MKRSIFKPRRPPTATDGREARLQARAERTMAEARPRASVMAVIPAEPAQSIAKDEPVRSEAYRRVVASLPCIICGVPGYSQAAHGSEGKGMGIKACDLTLFPACCDRPGVRGCHGQLDQGALFNKSARRLLEVTWAADTQRRVRAMGLWPANIEPGKAIVSR